MCRKITWQEFIQWVSKVQNSQFGVWFSAYSGNGLTLCPVWVELKPTARARYGDSPCWEGGYTEVPRLHWTIPLLRGKSGNGGPLSGTSSTVPCQKALRFHGLNERKQRAV